MPGPNTIRLVAGFGTVGIAIALAVIAINSRPAPPPPDSDPRPETVRLAVERGVDLTIGMPSEDRDRLAALHESGACIPFDDITFRDGLYFTDANNAEAFSGYASAAYDSGNPRVIACIIDGRLQGPSVELFEDGSLRRSMRHKDGMPVGQILEFYADGTMKLRAMSYGPDESGGSSLREIFATKPNDDSLGSRSLGSGRIQFIDDRGSTEGRPDLVHLPGIAGWMLFTDSALGGESVWTNDSRQLAKP